MYEQLDAELIRDETLLAEVIIAGIAERIPEWEPSEGSPEVDLSEAVALVLGAIAELVLDEERRAYEGFGANILGRPRGNGQVAYATSTWTFTAPGDYVIPDGSEVILDAADGTPWAFATVGDHAASGLEATGVQLVALEPGAGANGLEGEGREFEALAFVEAVELTSPASDGADPEELEAYLDVIADRARRLKVVPIDVDDYAAIPLDHPAVARCLAVRLLDPADPPAGSDPPDSQGHVTVFPVDVEGEPSSAPVKAEVIELLEGVDRPLAVTVHAESPTYTSLTLAVSIRLEVDADPDLTVAAVEAALEAAYDPAQFGRDERAPGLWRGPTSTAERTVWHYDVAHVADGVYGVAGVTAATVNGGASVLMTGWAPLPDLTGTPVVTVVT